MEREKREAHLTNEGISTRFKSQFDLVNHAIVLATHRIKAGHEPSLLGPDNVANEVLLDIRAGRDALEDLVEDEEEELEIEVFEEEEVFAGSKKGRKR